MLKGVGSVCFLAFLLCSFSPQLLDAQDLQAEESAVGSSALSALDDNDNDRKSFASASAVSQSESNIYPRGLLSPGYYGSGIPTRGLGGESSASASAEVNSGGFYPSRSSLFAPYLGNRGYSTSQAQSSASSSNGGGYGSSYASADALSSGQSEASAEAIAQADSSQGFYSPGQYGLNYRQSSAEVNSNEDRMGHFESEAVAAAHAEAQGFVTANRGPTAVIVPQHEYLFPHLLPERPQVRCTREGEFYKLWSAEYQCLVCACFVKGGYLTPICVECNGCSPPVPPSIPEPIPLPMPLPPPPDAQVSCNPLPTDTPFQNPLNPCQICVCRRSYNLMGVLDIVIECERNPQCFLPPEPLPPMPVPPAPVPLPLCDRFPLQVPFPHPSEICKICMCVTGLSPFGLSEYEIICVVNQECELKPVPDPVPLPVPIPYPDFPEPIPVPVPDYPEPVPIYPQPIPIIRPDYQEPIPHPEPIPYPEPIPIPEPVEPIPGPIPYPEPIPYPGPQPVPEPIPWPPVVPLPPAPPSPLPGPPPHESCRPYPPNQPFQHPWDECQVCICSEIYSAAVINIEVNCYTKQTCCIIPPIEPPISQRPLLIPDQVQFITPQQQVIYPGGGGAAEASAYANSQSNVQQLSPQYLPSYNTIGGGTSATSSAEALANAGMQYQTGLQFNGLYRPDSNAQALANALANSNSLHGGSLAEAQALANAQSNPGYYYGPSASQPGGFSNALAEALANAVSVESQGNIGLQYSPYGQSAEALANSQAYAGGGYSQSAANAQAQIEGLNQYHVIQKPMLSNVLYPSVYPNPGQQYPGLGAYDNLAQAQAHAQAQAQAQAQAAALAQAQALAQSQGQGGMRVLARPTRRPQSIYKSGADSFEEEE